MNWPKMCRKKTCFGHLRVIHLWKILKMCVSINKLGTEREITKSHVRSAWPWPKITSFTRVMQISFIRRFSFYQIRPCPTLRKKRSHFLFFYFSFFKIALLIPKSVITKTKADYHLCGQFTTCGNSRQWMDLNLRWKKVKKKTYLKNVNKDNVELFIATIFFAIP